MPRPNAPDNPRRDRQRDDRTLVILVVAVLLLVGGGLIALILGPEALVGALPCLCTAAGLVLGPWLLLVALERWRDRIP